MSGRLARLAAAVAASLWLGRLPLPTADPFRPTLLALPWVVLGFVELSRWAWRRGAHSEPRPVLALEAGLLFAWLFVVRARRALGLGADAGDEIDNLLYAALLLLLAQRVARLLPALRRAIGERLPERPPWPFFLLPLVVYAAILPWSAVRRAPDGDEPYYLLLTHSLAYDLDVDLANNYARQDSLRFMPRALEPEWGDPPSQGERRFSRHHALLPLVLAPAYRVAGAWGAFAGMALLGAATAWWTLRLAARMWPARPAESVAAWALLCFTPPFVFYALQVWVEVPAALLLVVALDRIWGWRGGPGDWLALAAVLVLLPLLKLRFLLLAVPLALLALWRLRAWRRRLLAPVAALAVVTAGILVSNQLRFRAPLRDHTFAYLAQLHLDSPLNYLRGAAGLLFDCAFGLFAVNPLWLLLLPGAWLVIRRRHPLALQGLFCVPLYLAAVAPRLEWYGAWSPPFRLGLVFLPWAALWLVPAVAAGRRRQGARLLTALAGALAGVLALLWLAVPGWTYHLADGGNQLLAYLGGRWRVDAVRLFPSFVRLRAASWVWPLACLAAAALLWRWRGRPARPTRPALWGVAVLLAAGAAVPVAAGGRATRRGGVEDAWVVKRGGELYPQRWLPRRPRLRGGWLLSHGTEVTAPVVPGGRALSVLVHVRPLGVRSAGARLEIEAPDGRRLIWPVAPPRRWRVVRFDLGLWPPGEELVVRLRDPARVARVVVDRLELRWGPG